MLWIVYEEIVIEGCDIKEDGLVVQEELCEERQVLREELYRVFSLLKGEKSETDEPVLPRHRPPECYG